VKLTKHELTRSILSTECSFCEAEKRSGAMFCEACWEKLPENIKQKIKNGLRSLSEALLSGIEALEK
jgi:hypothetical protein